MGWSTTEGGSVEYKNMADVTDLASAGESVTLYAVWKDTRTIFNITYMQDMTSTICDNTTTPSSGATETTTSHSFSTDLAPETTLTDSRDGKTYTIRKLADGNCWMAQNLDLDLDTNTALTPEDSDVSADWTPSESTFTGASSGWQGTDQNSHSYDPGNRVYISFYTSDDGDTSATEDSHSANTGHVGNFYNWYGATAGTGNESLEDQYDNASGSVCPKGWKLPTEYDSSSDAIGDDSYYKLLTTTYKIESSKDGTIAILNGPLSFVRAGYYDFDFNRENGTDYTGYYWTSTLYSAAYVYHLTFYSDGSTPRGRGRHIGDALPIRCVAK